MSALVYRAMSDADYDNAVANFKAAKANVSVGKATIRQNAAAVRVARTNLNYTTVKSPVRGEIIERRVNIGQTVVASLNAPSLFLIAKDLRADPGVGLGQRGRYRPHPPGHAPCGSPWDAYPGEVFRGKVSQIRLNATMTQNIVTYTVVVTTDNSSGKLLPYLTANAQFEVGKRSDVLPRAQRGAAVETRCVADRSGDRRRRFHVRRACPRSQDRGCLWIPADRGFVRPVDVSVGTSDGTMTEVSGDNVKEGMQVVLGEQGTEGRKRRGGG